MRYALAFLVLCSEGDWVAPAEFDPVEGLGCYDSCCPTGFLRIKTLDERHFV